MEAVESKTVGVDAIITTDFRLAEHYERRHREIKHRFDDMIVNLPETYVVTKAASGTDNRSDSRYGLTQQAERTAVTLERPFAK